MSVVHVAVGVVIGAEAKICITKRPEGKHLSGFWEFPGGKVEPGESVVDALTRELLEELGISVLESEKFTEVQFAYPDKTVLLEVLKVTAFDGVAQGKEGQALRWVSLDELTQFEFPQANQAIIAALLNR